MAGGWTGISARDGLLFKLSYNNDKNAVRAVESVNACISIEDPETTVPEMAAVCDAVQSFFEPKSSLPPDIQATFRRMISNDPILKRVRAVLAKTGKA